MRIGYLIPEFPGQTHIFFWRELQSLTAMGLHCDLVSTRRPAKKIISHTWSQAAMRDTTYLSPPRIAIALEAMAALIRCGPVAWWRIARVVAQADAESGRQRLRLLALSIVGAQLVALARRRRWCHLHVHSCADSALLAVFAHLIGGLTYSLTLHGPMEDYGMNQPLKWQHAEFGIVITKKLLKEVRAALPGVATRHVEVAPMGVNTRVFCRTKAYEPWAGSGSFRVFSCGRLNPCKGHDDLIRAVALLRRLGVDVRLQIAGADDAHGGCAGALAELIVELELGNFVTLLGGVSEDAIRQGLEASHVFSLASLQEPLGVAIMEAMAMEMPVVVTRGGGVPELVDDGIDGILVAPRDPEGLARALKTVAADPGYAARLAKAARTKIEASFQSDQSARTLLRMLKSVKPLS